MMKKTLNVLLIAVCLMMAVPVQAQFQLGVKGGLNMSEATLSKSDFKKDNFTGFFIGPMAELTIPVVGLGIDASLLFSQRGVKLNDEKVKQNGFDIPVNLKYTAGLGSLLGIYIAAGPDFFFDMGKDKSIYGFKINRKKSQVGMNIGAGLKLFHHLQLGVNYSIPLDKTGEFEGTNFSYKTKTWQISAAYMF